MNNNDLKNRTKAFAHRFIKLTLALPDSILGRHIKGQLTRSSTSVAEIIGLHAWHSQKAGLYLN